MLTANAVAELIQHGDIFFGQGREILWNGHHLVRTVHALVADLRTGLAPNWSLL